MCDKSDQRHERADAPGVSDRVYRARALTETKASSGQHKKAIVRAISLSWTEFKSGREKFIVYCNGLS